MSRDKHTPQDDENRQEPDDIIRFQTPPRSQSQRRREARDEKLRRIRQPSSPRPRQTRNFREEEERERSYRQAQLPSEPRQNNARRVSVTTRMNALQLPPAGVKSIPKQTATPVMKRLVALFVAQERALLRHLRPQRGHQNGAPVAAYGQLS